MSNDSLFKNNFNCFADDTEIFKVCAELNPFLILFNTHAIKDLIVSTSNPFCFELIGIILALSVLLSQNTQPLI